MKKIYLIPLFLLTAIAASSQQTHAIKIGESSDAFTNIIPITPSVYCMPDVGAGVVTALYRKNIYTCGGPFSEKGINLISISSDGGKSWDVGPDTVPPAFNGCYGRGPIYTLSNNRLSYFPSMTMFSRNNSPLLDSLALVSISALNFETYAGFAHSIVMNPASPAYTLRDEGFFNETIYLPYSLTPQLIPGSSQNFWLTAYYFDGLRVGPDMYLIKGKYKPLSKEIDWATEKKIKIKSPFGTTVGKAASPVVAFDPSGKYGWMAFLGDLPGGQDSTYNPVFMKTEDFGASWGEPEEVDLSMFLGLRESMLNSQTGARPTGKATCGYDGVLTVDENGNPHFLVTIAAASTEFINQADYKVYPESFLALYDVTRLACEEDWQLIHVDNLNAMRGAFGDTITPLTFDTYVQISRSKDGSKILYSWTDSDTTGQARPTNGAPDLKGRALDIQTGLMTPVVNWTANDTSWQGLVLNPKTSTLCLQKQDTFTLPTVVLKMDSNVWSAPSSYWYFPHISYAQADFSIPFRTEFTCSQVEILPSAQITEPGCGLANGAIQLNPVGGQAPYSFQWGANAHFADSAQVGKLAAGFYRLSITDSRGCQSQTEFILNNPNPPPVSIDSLSVQIPLCHGDSNGRILAITPLSSLSFLWSNGETTPLATALPAGRHELKVSTANGCEFFWVYEMEEPDSLQVEVKTTPSVCAFDQAGSAHALVTGGLGAPYTIKWSNGWQGEKAVGLNGGPLAYTISDHGGCQLMDTIQIPGSTEPLRYESIEVKPSTSCQYPNYDGEIKVKGAGGTAPYRNFWYGFYPSDSIQRLAPGLYTFELIDSLGCSIHEEAFIAGPTPDFPVVRLSMTDSICDGGPDFDLEIQVLGGNPPFTYTWLRDFGTSSTVVGSGPVLSDVYSFRTTCLIEQASGCDLLVKTRPWSKWKAVPDFGFARPHPNPQGPQGVIQAAASRVKKPFDYSYQWDSGERTSVISGLSPGNYGATFTDSGWCTVAAAFELEPAFSPYKISAEIVHDCKSLGMGEIRLHIPPALQAYSLQWEHGPTHSSLTGLYPGTYRLAVFDSTSFCVEKYSFHLRESLPLEVKAQVTPIACKGGNDGRIDLTVCGGSGYPLIHWSTGDSSQHLQNLPLGSYTVHVTDEMACHQDSLTVVMTEVQDSLKVAAATPAMPQPVFQGKAFATASGGWPPYTYSWNSWPVQDRDTAHYLPTGMYQVIATDRRGCIASDSVRVDTRLGIEQLFSAEIHVYPNPNSGDFWLDISAEFPQQIELEIFDIQGKILAKEVLGHQSALHHRIQLEEVRAGMYFLKVKIGKGIWREKILIKR